MIVLIAFILITLCVILIFFSFPELSPVPYFPSNKNDKDLILKALTIRKDQAVIDFGAGDGWVLFTAAAVAYQRKLNTHFTLVEINPFLLIILHIKWLLHPNRKNITVLRRDMFKMTLQTDSAFLRLKHFKNVTLYLYVSPRFLPTLTKKFHTFRKKTTIVTYFYPLSDKKPDKTFTGQHNVYVYDSA